VSQSTDAQGAAATVEQPEQRDVRALTEAMSVIPHRLTLAKDEVPPGGCLVVTASGSYIVEPDLGACTCGDARHRDPDGGCKHVRRARFERGDDALPGFVAPEDCGPGFRDFIDPDTEGGR
jgi:hypothetical protein